MYFLKIMFFRLVLDFPTLNRDYPGDELKKNEEEERSNKTICVWI